MIVIDGLVYLRYGDDLFFAARSPEIVEAAVEVAEEILTELELRFHPGKSENLQLTCRYPAIHCCSFRCRKTIDYLGFSISDHGHLFISRRKLQLLKKSIRETLRATTHAARSLGVKDKGTVLKASIDAVNRLLAGPAQHAYVSLLLWAATDEERLKELDRWIATSVIGGIWNCSRDGAFKHVSFRELRKRRLLSLRHLRNTRHRWVTC